MLMFLLVAFYHSKSDTCSDKRIHIYHLLQTYLSAPQGNIYVSRCAFHLEMTLPAFLKQYSKTAIHRRIGLCTSHMDVKLSHIIIIPSYHQSLKAMCLSVGFFIPGEPFHSYKYIIQRTSIFIVSALGIIIVLRISS